MNAPIPTLEPALRRALEQEALPEALGACRVEPAGLGEAIGDLAAVSVALYRSGYWEETKTHLLR
mgnify:CR=1 FL=1